MKARLPYDGRTSVRFPSQLFREQIKNLAIVLLALLLAKCAGDGKKTTTMIDQELANEIRAEGLREDFYAGLKAADWNECRAALKDMEEMKIDTYKLRAEMNTAMADYEDGYDGAEEEVEQDMTRESYHDASLSSQAESYGGAY